MQQLEADIKEAGIAIAGLENERVRAASPLAAFEHWNIEQLIGRQVTTDAPATFDEMMPLWVGGPNMRPTSKERIEEYNQFVKSVVGDTRYLDLLKRMTSNDVEITEADLSSPHDYLLIEHFLRDHNSEERLCILEIGAGYGKLASTFLKEMDRPFTYILSDGIPESIYYSYAYLRENFPSLNIYSAFDRAPLPPLESIDVLVLPSWRLPELQSDSIDVMINIASIQEMPDQTVEAYFKEISRLIAQNGLFFFENSREYAYRRDYDFPSNWAYLLKKTSPRSRTLDYPVDILLATDSDQTDNNLKFLYPYYREISKTAIDKYHYTSELLRSERKKFREVRAKLMEASQSRNSLLSKIKHAIRTIVN